MVLEIHIATMHDATMSQVSRKPSTNSRVGSVEQPTAISPSPHILIKLTISDTGKSDGNSASVVRKVSMAVFNKLFRWHLLHHVTSRNVA